jgi:ribosomal protein L24E
MYISKTGKVLYFKNRKAEKNFLLLKRKPRTTKWTGDFHADDKGQEPAKEVIVWCKGLSY